MRFQVFPRMGISTVAVLTGRLLRGQENSIRSEFPRRLFMKSVLVLCGRVAALLAVPAFADSVNYENQGLVFGGTCGGGISVGSNANGINNGGATFPGRLLVFRTGTALDNLADEFVDGEVCFRDGSGRTGISAILEAGSLTLLGSGLVGMAGAVRHKVSCRKTGLGSFTLGFEAEQGTKSGNC